MFINFGAKNFFSFKEGFDISFELGNTCPEKISNGKPISNILCVKGANGSGKTNILKAINFISSFISHSFELKPDSYLPFDPYFTSTENSEFYVTFVIDNVIYRYEAELTEKEVKRETLFRKSKREVKVIERINDNVIYAVKEYDELKTIKMRKNVSLFSMAMQYEVNSIYPIHNKFRSIISNVSYQGLMAQTHSIEFINEFYYKNDLIFDFAKKIMMKFDPSIKNIYIAKSKDEDGNDSYKPWFSFEFDGEEDILGLNLQSSGTKSLYRQLGSYKVVLTLGGLLVLDEFDINLHPHILPHLLEFFLEEESNSANAQLIFTTHNTEILDFLGKHRTYLVNKNNTESYCYRLDEIPSDILRNDRPISPAYNQGKIGGVPNL
ncbi:AAA family ATPase [Enterobacter asburiae]|uniref:AAA family ATPase n=1 Tax=Enterobacter asburiae TaxID=61645 RepID=UPI0005F91F3E|nr:ATP-binding protein [Enterobacter asburiae]KJW77706.1 abortive infection protein [Enterobacter asburiae]KJX05604.1 abortive infection protein [Enterobacter asburiae]HDT1101973.1 ATP-binding protein [Enterobacter asburiae]HDW0517180.1 ATP-binding protein [Enterobacter asburiae]HDW1478673.1 ATP-binding protein [Enterobacter asburiae]